MPTTGMDLKLQRVRANLTITEVAARIGISRQSVSVLESRAVVGPDRAQQYVEAVVALRDASETPRGNAA